MPLSSYGVLVARAVARRREGGTDTPHFQVHAEDDAGVAYRVAINVRSQLAPSELLYLVDDAFAHPVTTALAALGPGWNRLPSQPGGASLDFIRANLFDPARMRPLPHDVAGPDNDLADLLDHYVQRAIRDEDARMYVFGERWGPEPATRDPVFGFLPGNGVHDVHMNQGNSGRFQRDDGVWQDGALLVRFPGASQWVAIFLAFQSQAWHTDDVTGHAIDAPAPPAASTDAAVRIVGALINPVGPAPEREHVLLLNASPAPVDLTGWRLADRVRRTCAVPAEVLEAGATLQVPVTDGVQLGNAGGSLTLLDAHGLKVAGVAYTARQAEREGWTVTF